MRKKLLLILTSTILVASTLVGCGQSSTLTILSIAEGNVFVMKAGTDDWIEGQVGMSLGVRDTIKTGDDSGAEITFFDGSTIELKAGTEIEIVSLDISTDTGSTTISLKQVIGSTVSRVIKILDPASRYEVETPAGVVAVRGSVMLVSVIEDGTTRIINQEGNVYAIAQGVELQVPEGQQCIIIPGQPPKFNIVFSAGSLHTVGLKSDGTVVAAGPVEGEWDYGQCDIGNWTGIIQVAAGFVHTVGLKYDGTVVAVGHNDDRQCNVGRWENITQVAVGDFHTVGLKSDGTVVAIGNNDFGQCDVGGWGDITQVSAGDFHTVGLKDDGTVVAVGPEEGERDYGQCDVGGWGNITQVAAGCFHTVGLKSDGTMVAIGNNDFGQCDVGGWGDITQVAAGCFHTVGLKSDGTVVAAGPKGGEWDYGQCNVSGWRDIIQVSAGTMHTVGLKSNGTLVAVGPEGGEWDFGQCDVGDWNLGATSS